MEARAAPIEPPAGLTLTLFLVTFLAFPVLGTAAQLADISFGLLWTEAFLFLMPAWLMVAAYHGRPTTWLRLDRPPATAIVLGVLLGLANYPLAGALEAAIRIPVARVFPNFAKASDIAASTLGAVHGWRMGVLIVGIGAVAPFCEEVAFRGLQQQSLARKLRPGAAIAVTAALFSLIHWEPIGALARFELGVLFGLLLRWTGSLWPGIAAHAANNLFASSLYAFFGAGDSMPDASWLQVLETAALGFVLAAPLVYAAWRLRRPHEEIAWVPPEPIARRLRSGIALAVVTLVLLLGVALATGSFGGQTAR